MTYKDKAIQLFMEGANCAQAVFGAFAPMLGLEHRFALRLAAPLGGGLGRQREVCGAVSGMCLVAGALYGYDDVQSPEKKAAHYRLVQELCDAFRARFGTIICRELLDEPRTAQFFDPEPRNEEYYRTRPCARQVGVAAEIIEAYILAHPVGKGDA